LRLRRLLGFPAIALSLAAVAPGAGAVQSTPPTTTFEDSAGASWTPHLDELGLLEQIAAESPRVEIEVIGETDATGRPLHLVRIGEPTPHSMVAAQDMPVELHICTQHGNEPAGREACLIAIRDLAFTDDPVLVEQLANQVMLFIPSANPDGREADTRENALGVDLNRNHLEVEQSETRAIGAVIRDWKPAINMDHHEYGPVIPGLYDDDVLYLWPRNLNVHQPLREMARDFAKDFLNPCLLEQGYRSDEYGLYSLGGQPAPDLDLQQSAGDEDDGISRNAAGLRHGLGLLVESLSADAGLLPDAAVAPLRQRRVASHRQVIDCTMTWMRDHAADAFRVSRESMTAKQIEGAQRSEPVWFNGQDEDTTVGATAGATPTSFADPAPCGYLVNATDAEYEFPESVAVHGIATMPLWNGDVFVDMAQSAEPVIGLLLDARATRHLVAAEPLDDCSPYQAVLDDAFTINRDDRTLQALPSLARTAGAPPLPATGGGLVLLGLPTLFAAARLRRGR